MDDLDQLQRSEAYLIRTISPRIFGQIYRTMVPRVIIARCWRKTLRKNVQEATHGCKVWPVAQSTVVSQIPLVMSTASQTSLTQLREWTASLLYVLSQAGIITLSNDRDLRFTLLTKVNMPSPENGTRRSSQDLHLISLVSTILVAFYRAV